jgi:type VI secretion system protein ImpB
VELNFRSIDDFDPIEVIKQVEPLRKLFDARQRLMDLLAKLDGNDKLDALLQEIVANPDNQKALQASTAAPTA